MVSRRVDLWVDERGVFESVELTAAGGILAFSTYAFPLLGLSVDTHDEFTLQVNRLPNQVYLLRVASIALRDGLLNDLRRQVRIAGENRLIEEADDLIADFEERLYDDIPSFLCLVV